MVINAEWDRKLDYLREEYRLKGLLSSQDFREDVAVEGMKGQQKIEQIKTATQESNKNESGTSLENKTLGTQNVKVEPNVYPSRV